MTELPEPIIKFINALSELPSIGPRQATRLAFFLVSRGAAFAHNLAVDINSLGKVKICARCFFVHQNEGVACSICSNANRQQDVIMIVEKETDLVSLEKTGKFTGRYFIIGSVAKTGMLEEWQQKRLAILKSFITKEFGGSVQEVIMAFNPTSTGNFTTTVLTKELQPFTKKTTRLGRGLPTGGEVEFADEETLGSALERRS